MNVEDYVVARVNALMHTDDATIVKRLEGGMSNYTYVVQTRGKKYTYRVPGKYAEKFVDRVEEWDNIQDLNRFQVASGREQTVILNNATSYVEVISGEKLAEYVEGTILSDTDVVSYNALSVAALKRIHGSDMHFRAYNAFGRLADYERYCREKGFTHPREYVALREQLEMMRDAHAAVPMVPCHCDYQPTNLVVADDKIYVLDWEFAGMNDPIYDVACYGNAGFDKALSLLEAYVGHKPTSEELRRLYFHRSFQCLQWYNVAIFKDRAGLSRDLNMNFNEVATFFFGMARDLAAQYDTL